MCTLPSRVFVRIRIYSKWGQNHAFVSRRTENTIAKLGMQIGTSLSLFVGYVRQNRRPLFTLTFMLCIFLLSRTLFPASTKKKSHLLRIVESARNCTKLHQFALCVCIAENTICVKTLSGKRVICCWGTDILVGFLLLFVPEWRRPRYNLVCC